ncbi:AraC family transcriptional regulator [Rhizorhabdus wittichii]|uniref:Transcriptional regulator, AraC family n=2 Tax=Rhizorhabdus wittichii TaxID=160791 RepID=A0A9J9HB40_RHIWR|nr:AraC family transcriptional regulator [Rhizorhabdus wittichii]ABQ68401.1 transcriptional regulator, AraC family [Rhizorhabdus wittichii RW1]ARR54703.1 AraC family transcriptional regulator [Rhizorhabdus wittichii DC-6]QTH21241.1 AraC family transcriptional regulator ligand-binding domain-containing protein [Rhizorhabdus wittichii]
MSRHKHVVPVCNATAPTGMIVTMLDCLSRISGEPDRLLAEVGVSHSFAAFKAGQVREIGLDAFIATNRACNARFRDYLHQSQGPQMTEEQFSLLCRCLIACADLREVLTTTSSFFAMFNGTLGAFRPEFGDRHVTLFIEPRRRGPTDPSFLIDAFGMAVLQLLFGWLIGRSLALERVDFSYPASVRTDFGLGLFSCPVRFDRPSNIMLFDAVYLSAPVVRTSSDMRTLLETFPYDMMLGRDRGRSLADQVYALMMNAHSAERQLPGAERVARDFGVSSWTLRRRLAEEGTGFSRIRQRCQLNITTDFLRRPDLTIDRIAEIANFSDANAFRRAFQQWTGKSPTAFRRELAAGRIG